MKKILIILLAYSLTVSLDAAAQRRVDVESGARPELSFRVKEHDFGSVWEKGRKVSYDYVFTNTGSAPLVITRTITSCRCVDVEYNKKPVPPGGQGMISVTYNPRKQQGLFYKAIQIFSNSPEGVQIIIVKGVVRAE